MARSRIALVHAALAVAACGDGASATPSPPRADTGSELEAARQRQRASEASAAAAAALAEASRPREGPYCPPWWDERLAKRPRGGSTADPALDLADVKRAVAEQMRRNEELQRLLDEADRERADALRRLGGPRTLPPPRSPELPQDPTLPPPAPSETAADAEIRGTVQAASVADDVFVLSIGRDQGVATGDEFRVTRDDRDVCTVVVDTVFPYHCAAHTKPGTKAIDASPGDVAVRVPGRR